MSSPTEIYRIQHKVDGRGPFRPGFSHVWVVDRYDHANLPPTQDAFSGGVPRVNRNQGRVFGCGCRTVEQPQRWFIPEEYATLKSLGYVAVKMRVEVVVIESEVQLIFQRTLPLTFGISYIDLYPEICPSVNLALASSLPGA